MDNKEKKLKEKKEPLKKGDPGFYPAIFNWIRYSGIALLFVGVAFGTNYTFENWLYAIIASVFMVGILVWLSDSLLKLKKKERKIEDKKPEYVLLAIYIVSMIPALIFFAHYINIETHKDKFQIYANKRVNEIKGLIEEYNEFVQTDTSNFRLKINNLLKKNREDFDDNDRELLEKLKINKDKYDKLNELLTKRAKDVIDGRIVDLYYNFDTNEVKRFCKEAEITFNQWNTLNISATFKQIDIIYKDLQDTMISASIDAAGLFGDTQFKPKDLEKAQLVLNNPLIISNGFSVTLILFLLINLLILSVYFRAERFEYPFRTDEETDKNTKKRKYDNEID